MNASFFNTKIAPELRDATNRDYLDFRNLMRSDEFNKIDIMEGNFMENGVYVDNIVEVVLYRPGFVAYHKIANYEYGISFQFTGCAFVRFSHLRSTYIMHISLAEAGNVYDTRQVWNEFLRKILRTNRETEFSNFILFKPFDDRAIGMFNEEHFLDRDCCGIIDSSGKCYSAVLDNGLNNKSDMYKAIDLWPTESEVIRVKSLLESNASRLIIR